MAVIKIKGLNDSLVFIFGKGTFQEYYDFLQENFTGNKRLFEGSRIIFKGDGLQLLSHEEIAVLQKLCLENGMLLNNLNVHNSHPGTSHDTIIHRNIRSGQRIRSEGSMVIWGNVHESAEIIAARDIVVLGKLEGIAHAGFYGDTQSVIFALNLNPGQIRIADKISRSPGNFIKNSIPEIAYLDGSNICIKEYDSRDNVFKPNITSAIKHGIFSFFKS